MDNKWKKKKMASKWTNTSELTIQELYKRTKVLIQKLMKAIQV